jgi:hypothetical protein
MKNNEGDECCAIYKAKASSQQEMNLFIPWDVKLQSVMEREEKKVKGRQ